MTYDLPAARPVTVAGPDDPRWSVALDVDLAGRHAVILGDPSTPGDPVVLAGALPTVDTTAHVAAEDVTP
jgi:hypothetical protein